MDFIDDLIDFKKNEIMISNGGSSGEMRDLLTCFMHQYQHDEVNGSHQFLQGNPEFTVRKSQR